ncbi:MAG: hypothetical protein ACYS99_10970 [Planctomycetota bacterium]
MARRRKHRSILDEGTLRFWAELLFALAVIGGISYLAVSLF